jgi:hypothetical protein
MKVSSWTSLLSLPGLDLGAARPSYEWGASAETSRTECDERRDGFDRASFEHCDGEGLKSVTKKYWFFYKLIIFLHLILIINYFMCKVLGQ